MIIPAKIKQLKDNPSKKITRKSMKNRILRTFLILVHQVYCTISFLTLAPQEKRSVQKSRCATVD